MWLPLVVLVGARTRGTRQQAAEHHHQVELSSWGFRDPSWSRPPTMGPWPPSDHTTHFSMRERGNDVRKERDPVPEPGSDMTDRQSCGV